MADNKKIRIKPILTVVCDSIRSEVTGKTILVGIYGGGMNVDPPMPGTKEAPVFSFTALAIWIPFEAKGVGSAVVELQIVGPSVDQKISLRGSLDIPSEIGREEMPALAFDGIPISMRDEGDLKILFRHQGDEEWETIRTMSVKFKTSSTESQPPS